MALVHPLVSHTFPSSSTASKPLTSTTAKSNPPPKPFPLIFTNKKSHKISFNAVTDDIKHKAAAPPPLDHDLKEEEQDHRVLVSPSGEEEHRGERVVAEYDWTEEWYPLYLTQDLPEDAPLGLTVFDKQLVLYRDGSGLLRCYEDRCSHRLAKLSEGQLIDRRLECLYHGWQFQGQENLPSGAKIPKAACVKAYEVRDSQGVVWVWMSHKKPPKPNKLPWFENFDRPGIDYSSTIHDLPYEHSILLENLMDPARIPISHDRTGFIAKRENAQPLRFEVTERTDRAFAGYWGEAKDQSLPYFLRFEAPGVIENTRELVDKNGEKQYSAGLFLSRPTGQGKSMAIMRFGATKQSPLAKLFPDWYFHHISSEYRKRVDRVGHGMPYHVGHSTISLPNEPAMVEHAPAGLVASVSASQPAKGGIGSLHVPNWTNRYFRHVIHCKGCRDVVKSFEAWKIGLSGIALGLISVAILVAGRQWKAILLVSAAVFSAGAYACSAAVALNTTNFIRTHRRL
ncbi:PREDICTED: TIC 55 [Prunus dulcis]|uniref:PREDICTED: TIC 55 n=1 Tax=Prunus dulcis TaxID=3755 RepID=A0A5E4ED28_PRUDU|nr:PREDICTED: TIC 55 [Prunus dulcis]